jgi:hypothetical protein
VQENFCSDSSERLIRVLADRQGISIELRVHYEVATENGCRTFRVVSVEDIA